jgi:hypothetical protein
MHRLLLGDVPVATVHADDVHRMFSRSATSPHRGSMAGVCGGHQPESGGRGMRCAALGANLWEHAQRLDGAPGVVRVASDHPRHGVQHPRLLWRWAVRRLGQAEKLHHHLTPHAVSDEHLRTAPSQQYLQVLCAGLDAVRPRVAATQRAIHSHGQRLHDSRVRGGSHIPCPVTREADEPARYSLRHSPGLGLAVIALVHEQELPASAVCMRVLHRRAQRPGEGPPVPPRACQKPTWVAFPRSDHDGRHRSLTWSSNRWRSSSTNCPRAARFHRGRSLLTQQPVYDDRQPRWLAGCIVCLRAVTVPAPWWLACSLARTTTASGFPAPRSAAPRSADVPGPPEGCVPWTSV